MLRGLNGLLRNIPRQGSCWQSGGGRGGKQTLAHLPLNTGTGKTDGAGQGSTDMNWTWGPITTDAGLQSQTPPLPPPSWRGLEAKNQDKREALDPWLLAKERK